MRLSVTPEELFPRNGRRRGSRHSIHAPPSNYTPQPLQCKNYTGGLIRSISHETYNDLVQPSSDRLGQDTPNCSKVIFNGIRQYHQNLILPKCKKKKKKTRSPRYKRESSRDRDSTGSQESSRINSFVETKNCFTSFSLQDYHQDLYEEENFIDKQKNEAFNSRKIIEYELDENEIEDFLRVAKLDVHEEIFNEKPTNEAINTRKIIEYELDENELEDFLRVAKLEVDEENPLIAPPKCKDNILSKINNFYAYYKMLCGKESCLDSTSMKALIIEIMYNKLFLLNHMKQKVSSPENNSDSFQCTIGGLDGKKSIMLINLPWGENQNLLEESIWNKAPVAISPCRPFTQGNNDYYYPSSRICLKVDAIDENVYSNDTFNYQNCFFFNESKSASYEGGAAAPSLQHAGRREGGIISQCNTNGRSKGHRSPVLAGSLSRAHILDYDSAGAFSEGDYVSSDCSDDDHKCDWNCEMPCKASGIPVYQGRNSDQAVPPSCKETVLKKKTATPPRVAKKERPVRNSSSQDETTSAARSPKSLGKNEIQNKTQNSKIKANIENTKKLTKTPIRKSITNSTRSMTKINSSKISHNINAKPPASPNIKKSPIFTSPVEKVEKCNNVKEPNKKFQPKQPNNLSTHNRIRKRNSSFGVNQSNESQDRNSTKSLHLPKHSSANTSSSPLNMKLSSSDESLNADEQRTILKNKSSSKIISPKSTNCYNKQLAMKKTHVNALKSQTNLNKPFSNLDHDSKGLSNRRINRNSAGDESCDSRCSTPTSLGSRSSLNGTDAGKIQKNGKGPAEDGNSKQRSVVNGGNNKRTIKSSNVPNNRSFNLQRIGKQTPKNNLFDKKEENVLLTKKINKSANSSEMHNVSDHTQLTPTNRMNKKVRDKENNRSHLSKPGVKRSPLNNLEKKTKDENISPKHSIPSPQMDSQSYLNSKESNDSQSKIDSSEIKNRLIDSLTNNLRAEICNQNNNIEMDGNIDVSKLSKIIDASLINNLKLNGEILSDQFDAIITTLKKVAKSMDMDVDVPPENKEQQLVGENGKNSKMRKSISLNDYNNVHCLQSNPIYGQCFSNTKKVNSDKFNPNFRKVNSESNVGINEQKYNKTNQLRRMSSLTKSRELLNHLEMEYKLLKGEDSLTNSGESLLNLEAKNLAKRFDQIIHPPAMIRKANKEVATQEFLPLLREESFCSTSDPPQRVTYKNLTLEQMGIPLQQDGHLRQEAITFLTPSEEGSHLRQEAITFLTPSEEGSHHRSMSLPKSFLSDRYGITNHKTSSGVNFPWRYEERDEDCIQAPQTSSQSQKSYLSPCPSKESQSYQQSEGHVTNIPINPGVSPKSYQRSSISHSEWDIRNSWPPPESGGKSAYSQSVYRLEEVSTHGHGASSAEEASYSMPYIIPPANYSSVNTATSNNSEGMFQKFKKSLSLRLNKKSSRSDEKGTFTPPIYPPREENGTMTSPKISRDEDMKFNYFKFGHPIFRSSKERKRTKQRDVRSSKCNSGDSGDSGIEVISGTSTLIGEQHQSTNPQTSEHHIINYLGHVALPEDESKNEKVVRRTQSDMSANKPYSKPSPVESVHRQSLGRQYSSPQPIKMRPLHRLPNYNSVTTMQKHQRMKRSKGSTHLRRSVSQPLDLDKSFQAQVSLMKHRTNDEAMPATRLRRPSVDNLLCEDNSSDDEGALSDNEEFKTDFKLYLDEEEEMIVYAEALWDHVSLDNDELVFKAGDLITVVDSSDRDWWWGKISHRSGWFPASFVRLLVNQEDHLNKTDIDGHEDSNKDRKASLSGLSYDQIRSNVINEILSTERDYVKHLRDVVEGYLRQVRKRPDMFSEESISTIFGNMEQLYDFHHQFLCELEQNIDFDEPYRSCIGQCFIQNKARFEIYSEYCNNHPSAVSELQQLYEDQKYVHFFEACRLLQEMIDISLDGFLLTPVQKICKYPLQLQELLKYTRPNHLDFPAVQGAMQAMKEVALLVNERRRRMECLEKIASWQKAVEGWEGPELLDDSSQLIHQGEVTKGVGGSWPKEVILFLFDHQIIYCKRDLLKRNTYVYRGRINTDLCEVIDIPDDPLRSANFHNAWKIHCLDKNKTYVFTCKSNLEKVKWISAFKKERDLVVMDEVSGFVVSEKQKQVARIAARNHKCRPKKPKTPKSHKRGQAMTYAQAKLLVSSDLHSNSLPGRGNHNESKKKGLWFSFGVNKKARSSSRSSKTSLQI